MKMMAELTWMQKGIEQKVEFADVNVAKSCYQALGETGVQPHLYVPSGMEDKYVKYEDDATLSEEEMKQLMSKINNMIRVEEDKAMNKQVNSSKLSEYAYAGNALIDTTAFDRKCNTTSCLTTTRMPSLPLYGFVAPDVGKVINAFDLAPVHFRDDVYLIDQTKTDNITGKQISDRLDAELEESMRSYEVRRIMSVPYKKPV